MENSHIAVEHVGAISILQMDRGETNPINLAVVEQLRSAIGKMRDDASTNGIVLTSSSSKFFSIGFDLPAFLNASKSEFLFFFDSFTRLCMDLFTFPKPTLAAIKGHAVAGGCILALACDYRIISEGHKLMGLNEIKLGVPVPYATDCMLRALVGTRSARDIMNEGVFYEPKESAGLGLVDAVVSPEEIIAASVAKVARLADTSGMFQVANCEARFA